MNANFISFGSLAIKWYSILLLTAFILGFLIVIKQKDKLNLNNSEVIDMLFYLIIVSIIGARIYYCLFNLDYYMNNTMDIFKVWEGGLAIHGGILFGVCYLLIYCYYKKINILKTTDVIVPALALGQAIGRWGNFFNQEAYGSVTTYAHLKSLHIPDIIIDGMYINHHYYHPTFLYESIWCFIIFIVLVILIKKKRNKVGFITSIYLMMYGLERFFLESMRQDSLMIGNLRVAQIVSILMIIIGILTCIYSFKKKVLYDK